MRRVFTVSVMMILLCASLWAELRVNFNSQKIGGYIEDIAVIDVSDFITPGTGGINLDYTDENSSYRYNIMPTSTSMTFPGLLIGNFDAYLTFSSIYTGGWLIITHDSMYCTNPGATEKPKEIDYELCAAFLLESDTGSEYRNEYCLSSDNHYDMSLSAVESYRSIRINLRPDSREISYIQDGGLYFRLANAFESIATGDYTSTVTLTLESL